MKRTDHPKHIFFTRSFDFWKHTSFLGIQNIKLKQKGLGERG